MSSNQTKESVQTFRSKLVNHYFDFVFICLIAPFTFLSLVSFSWIWLCFLLIFITLSYKHIFKIFVALLLGVIAFMVFKYFDQRIGEREIKHFDSFQTSAQKYLVSGDKYYSMYAPLMLLGVKTNESKEIYQIAVNINVVHLFVISGFHISLFYTIITKLLTFAKLNEKAAMLIPIFPIVFYLYLLGFPLSATRAFLLTLAGLINKIFLNKKYKSIDLLCVVMIAMLIYKPVQITTLSFILTFGATAAIMLVNEARWKTKARKYLMTCILVYLSTWPIIVSLNQFIAPLGILWGTLLAPLFIVVYSLSLFLFPIKGLMEWVYKIFDFCLRAINEINFTFKFTLINANVSKISYLALSTYPIIKKTWFLYTVKKNS